MTRPGPCCTLLTFGLLSAHPSLWACTAFSIASDRHAFFANNEDYNIPRTRLWFVPGEGGSFGRVYLGYGDDDAFPQGGMNERGLAFDMFSSPPLDVEPSLLPGFRGSIIAKMMGECATVDEAVKLFEAHSRAFMQRFILMVADASGDSAVIEQDAIVRKRGAYQVQTNFYQSRTKAGEISCERYKLAAAMLDKAAGQPGVDLCRRILAAVHQEGKSPTLYSNIFDLKRRVMYLYHFHNFENVVAIDLPVELKKGRRIVEMASLFPTTVAAERYARERSSELRAARPPRVRVDPKTLDAHLGVYQIPGLRFDVTRDADRLFLEPDAVGKVEIIPQSESKFFLEEGKVRISFVPGVDGKAKEIVIHSHGSDFRIPRSRD